MLKHFTGMLIALSASTVLVAAPAGAAVVPAYLGWNFISDTAANSIETLTGMTYYGGADTGGSSATESLTVPAFPGYVGMPDGSGLNYRPTYTTVEGGDGETTRTIGQALPIDWVPAGTTTPYGTYAFPTIGIASFNTAPGGTYFGFTGSGAINSWYIVGLITDAPEFGPPYTQPPPASDELNSTLPAPLGDIYDAANGVAGNPQLIATNGSDQMTVTFAAAVPEPATLSVLSCGLLGLGALRRKRG